MNFKQLVMMMGHSRSPIRVHRRRKKSALRTEDVNCCKDCKRMDLPWYRVNEEIKYGWKKLNLRQNDAKPCICWRSSLGESDCRNKEHEIRKQYFVQTKFSRCNDKTKIEFVRNGDAVSNMIREEEENFLAEQKRRAAIQREEQKRRAAIQREEQKRLAAIQREELEKQNLQRLKEILLKWEQNHKFPSSEQVPLTSSELKIQANQSLPKSEYRGITQIYILKFPKQHMYYVGETAKGYPRRVTEHCKGENSNVSRDLEFKDEGYEKNLLTEIMEIVQPYDMKCGWCENHANVLEFWMQERLKEANLTHHVKGRNTGLLFDATCKKCNDFALKYNIPWKS